MVAEGNYNRLKGQKSFYLKQHEKNPVHWHPYGPEALQRSKDENKPIFLSIGYSSCHWCHVMAHESFEDKEVANFLNKNFINIKIDREEFPDIDSYYQHASQLFSQMSGWPLSAFLLPDLKPFMVGTYYPKESQYGRPGFLELIKEMNQNYLHGRPQLEEKANKIFLSIKEGEAPQEKVTFEGRFPSPNSIVQAVRPFTDIEYGGHGSEPKFPNFTYLEWGIEQILEGIIDKERGEHFLKTIESIFMGGIYDQVRGGIHRYATDNKWKIPHFEKMLYDQAGLLRVLSKASLIYPSPLIFDALFDTLDYIEKEMKSDAGYFFSSQDADSEGVEGLFFTFSEEEFKQVIDSDNDLKGEVDTFIKWFSIEKNGNFHGEQNVLSLNPDFKKEIFSSQNWEKIRKIKLLLKEERKKRIPPATDNKGVASWNFMLLSSLIDVMQYCRVGPIRSKANDILNQSLGGILKTFLIKKETDSEPPKINLNIPFTNLRHSTTREESLPYLEDYVFFGELQLRIFEITGNLIFKDNFKYTLEFILDQFLDHNKLLTRAKFKEDFELYPNRPIPSYDHSFKSPTSTFIGLCKRGATLFSQKEYLDKIAPLIETSIQQALKNPVNSGEALRSHTYPEEVYKCVKIPRAWPENSKYTQFVCYFLPRFVFDFHLEKSAEESNHTWQICSLLECELQGIGLDNFIETLAPNKTEKD